MVLERTFTCGIDWAWPLATPSTLEPVSLPLPDPQATVHAGARATKIFAGNKVDDA